VGSGGRPIDLECFQTPGADTKHCCCSVARLEHLDVNITPGLCLRITTWLHVFGEHGFETIQFWFLKTCTRYGGKAMETVPQDLCSLV
jgi:hypothetical protein